MLFEAGRHEDALRWLSAVDDGFTGRYELLRYPAMYMRGQAHQQLGQNQQAMQLYERFIRAWEEADPALQPMVEDARSRLDALVLKGAQEPT